MNDLYPDFLNPNEKWKVERALELVNSYAEGYVANAGLHGGINQSTLLDLFNSSYKFISEVEKKGRAGELGK